MAGSVPDKHEISEDGARAPGACAQRPKPRLFLDIWPRGGVRCASMSQPSLGKKVLNLFAYTCAFSVVALQAGAKLVVNVDMSHSAMAIGQQNHQRNGVAANARYLVHDIFSTWGKITRAGPYQLIIVDPPSYQKGSFVATKDYAKLMRRLTDLLDHGGHALLCLNAPELDTAFLQDQMRELAPDLSLVERIANPASFADASPERALKVLLYRAPARPT